MQFECSTFEKHVATVVGGEREVIAPVTPNEAFNAAAVIVATAVLSALAGIAGGWNGLGTAGARIPQTSIVGGERHAVSRGTADHALDSAAVIVESTVLAALCAVAGEGKSRSGKQAHIEHPCCER